MRITSFRHRATPIALPKPRLAIEVNHHGQFAVIEFRENGFTVLGLYGDRATAETRLATFKAEMEA